MSRTYTAREADYTHKGEWGRIEIYRRPTGWRVETHSQVQGDTTATAVLLPYDTTIPRSRDLRQNHTKWSDYGEHVAQLAREIAADPDARKHYRARIIRRGYKVR